MKRLIIYDLDGTLVDTCQDIAEAVNHMLTVMYASPLPPKDIQQYVGRGLHDLIRRCLKTDDPAHLAQGTTLFETYYAAHLTDHSALYPGARETLDYFKTRIQAVITNKPDPFARDLLKALGVADYFVEIVAGGSRYPKKPDPTSLLAMMRQEGTSPPETLLVGDSAIDVDTGRRAGVWTVILSHGFAGDGELAAARPEATVSNFQELLALAREHGW